MPTYEYRCKDCGHTFDAYQSFTDEALTECPECAGALKKLFGNVGISFKGSGFYKNDSRSGAKSTTASSSGGDTGSSSSKDGSSSSDSSSTSTSTDSSSSTKKDAKKESTSSAPSAPAS